MKACATTLVASVLATPAVVRTQTRAHAHESASPTNPPITITINPEARVSVALAGALPPPVACGTAAALRVRIINQGFVTSRLEAQFIGNTPAGAKLAFHPQSLKGVPEELRELRITLTKRGPSDLTLSFQIHNNVPGLDDRNRVHLLMSCL